MIAWQEAATVPEGGARQWTVGPLEISVRNDTSGWGMATRLEGDPKATPTDDEHAWRKWVGPEGNLEVSLVPMMPDRPVLLKSPVVTNIPKGAVATLFVGLPVVVRVASGGVYTFDLGEIATYPYSNAWLGDTTSGEPCYSYHTTIHRRWEDVVQGDHIVIVPLRVRNGSDEVLEFQSVTIRALFLPIHAGATRLWTSTSSIRFLGAERVSDVETSGGPPDLDGPYRLLGPARKEDKHLVPLKSFPKFKTIMGF